MIRMVMPCLLLLPGVIALSGCASTVHHKPELQRYGEVYFVDGAGMGDISPWRGELERGLRDGGYRGDFSTFKWQTGLGPVADQGTSLQYKREKGAELADEIADYQRRYPNRGVALIGLSAGTAVVVGALESLPSGYAVEEVVLLGSSLSNEYDLTRALRRVRGNMHVFSSEEDRLLKVGIAMLGTADRKFCDDCAAGLTGFRLPRSASAETRQLYVKLRDVKWRPEFAEAGYSGGHTDATREAFVRDFIAPLVVRDTTRARFTSYRADR